VPARHFIANRFVAAHDGRTLPMLDPSDGSAFAAIARGSAADVDDAVRAAAGARDRAWGKLAPAARGRALAKIADAITAHARVISSSTQARPTSCTVRRFRTRTATRC